MEAKELLQEIKERVFKDTDLSGLARMSETERRDLLLQQTERLLSTRDNHKVIVWMADQIIDRDDEVMEGNPILDDETLDLKTDIEGLHEEETVFARFATRLAYFSYCMLNKYGGYFSTDRYLGINTEMISVAGEEAERVSSVEQDYFYGFFSAVSIDQSDIAQCNDYVITGIHTLEEAERHKQQAIQLGIDRECGSIVDSLCGTLMHDYPEQMVACAKELQQLSTSLLPKDRASMSRKKRQDWRFATLDACDPILKKYGIDLDTKEYNISMNYIMDWLDLKYNAKMYDVEF